MKFIFQLIIELIIIGLLFFEIINKNIKFLIIIIMLLIFLIFLFLNKCKLIKSRREKECSYTIFIYSFILMIILYIIGLKTGYKSNLSVIYKNYIEPSRFIYTVLIVLLVEIIRYRLLCINIRKYKKNILLVLVTIIFVLIDVSISTKTYNFNSFNNSFLFFALILLPSISKNIMLNYISNRYGYKPCIVYRIIMDLYIFIIPVTPTINDFIKATIYLIYPYFLYTIIYRIDNGKEIEPARKRHNYYGDIIVYIFAIIFVGLISREFKYCMIAIGSNSMKGYFSKGDAIIYRKYKKDKLKEGDVLVFTKEGRTIVHRIVEKYKLYDENHYITKGDANKDKDNWIVEEEDIVGVVECKIKFIGWPTVLVTSLY